jgi:pilus assembly protein CpaB
MNWKTWVPLVLAIVLGVVAAKAARDVMLKNKGDAANGSKLAKVVVTKIDVQPGTSLSSDDITFAQVDANHLPAGSFRELNQVVGRVSEALMVKGQPVVESMLAPIGAGSGLQALVPAGMRAITIEVNEFSGVAGLISPGCRVDVIATINDANGEGRIAKTIVQNVKVTAVGQRTGGGNGEAPPQPGDLSKSCGGGNGEAPPQPGDLSKSVTVLATLEDAEALELACSTGRPRLVLRGGRDNEVSATAGVTVNDLKGTGGRPDTGTSSSPIEVAVTPPPPAPTTAPAIVVAPPAATQPAEVVVRVPRRLVRIIKGGRVSVVSMTAKQLPEMEEPFDEAAEGKMAEGEAQESPSSDDAVGTIDLFDGK